MALVTLPFPLTAGTKARGSHVLGNDTAITDQLNGNVEDPNLKNAGITGSTKLVPLSVGSSVIGADAINESKVADEAIQAEHGKNDAARPPTGIGSNINAIFSESDQAAVTNVIAGRQQRGGKIIVAYFKITATGTSVLVDDSIDWRRRLVAIIGTAFGNAGAATGTFLPNGTQDHLINGAAWNAGLTAFGSGQVALFYTEAGRVDAGGNPSLVWGWDAAANTSLAFYALDTNGDLKCRSNSSFGGGGNTEVDVCAIILAGPYLGT